ncbi:hypothetical protein [Crocosphaera sp. XPORK-15E]|uniref:hypothetical protein n=1 Tax=Crocosphaera sp. XPORK-15E TaxID=3110247 RepID=UPI002B206687|nr:hypothetical protein [Crocosphaera sp. XPORK-15E]MEA5533871.1 hypothetical protein [Crocosphaera sp. XPORK-15E]
MSTIQTQENLITNITGEPYQPARLYYQVSNKKTVLGVFQKLKCMEYHPSSDRWYWLYIEEAKKIRFEQSYNKIPKDVQPVPLGYFSFIDDEIMILEVRSFQRLIEAIKFFQTRLNWRAAEPLRLRLVNKFFGSLPNETPKPPTSFAEFFDRDDIIIHSPEALEQELMAVESQYETREEKEAAITAYMQEKSKEPLPEIEEIAISIHEEGMMILEMALRMKHIEAWEHWNGNKDFTQYDLVQNMIASLPDNSDQE